MKAITLFIWGLFLSMGLSAQHATVIHCTGQVQYFPTPSSKAMRAYPSQELQVSGRLRCLKGGSAKLLYKGNTFVVSGTRLQNISDIVKSSKQVNQMTFGGRFWNFITESFEEGESTEKLRKHHREYMNNNSAAIKGYASKEFSIATSFLTVGKLPAANVTFKWRNVPGSGPYSFKLADANGNIVAQLLAQDTVVTLDLDQLAMDIQGDYQWNVTRNKGDDCSATISFELTDKPNEKAPATLSQSQEFQTASQTEQRLMLAYYLEQEKSFYTANNIYEQLLVAEPGNLLVRKLYATFLARMDMLQAGLKLLEQK